MQNVIAHIQQNRQHRAAHRHCLILQQQLRALHTDVGVQLRNSEFIDTKRKEDVIALAEAGKGTDSDGYRAEFIRLVKSSN